MTALQIEKVSILLIQRINTLEVIIIIITMKSLVIAAAKIFLKSLSDIM